MEPATRYALGVAMALVSAGAINVGLLVQKRAVASLPSEGPLFARLVRNRPWVLGFLLQALLGAPLNVAAIGLLGPALVPGLMALGLVVLAVGAARFADERIGPTQLLGIALVVAAVAALGASGLQVDVFARSPVEAGLLLRTLLLCVLMAALAFAGERWAARKGASDAARAIALALASGAWLALSTLGIGVVQACMAWLGRDRDFGSGALLIAALSAVVLANIKAVALTQRSFQCGKASVVIPMQQAPVQVFPILVFYLVYRPFLPSGLATALALVGVAAVLSGAVLLGRSGEGSAG